MRDTEMLSDSITVSFVELPDGARHWPLVTDYLKLRKDVFLDEKCWPLQHHQGLEYEQYDTFDTVYVVACQGDRLVGGGRLRRTDRTNGRGAVTYSYMIRDAWRGILPMLPAEICASEPPVASDVWELTRLATIGPPAVAIALLTEVNRYLRERGARECLFLGSPAFVRMAKRLGWDPRCLGPVTGNEDGRFVAFSCPVLNDLDPVQAEPRGSVSAVRSAR